MEAIISTIGIIKKKGGTKKLKFFMLIYKVP